MCQLQTLLKVDQLRFDALKVLQVMIRARCFAPPFNISIKKRYARRDLIEKLQQLDLPGVMAQEIRAAYMVNHSFEINMEGELPFDKDVERVQNAYLIKRFELFPRIQDYLNRIQNLVDQGLPSLPTHWQKFLTSNKGTPALMAAKVRLLREIYDSLRQGHQYAFLEDYDPLSWINDKESYLKVRELVENRNPNAFDDFIYDKLKARKPEDVFSVHTQDKNVTFDSKSKKSTVSGEKEAGDDGKALLEPMPENYPDWRNVDSSTMDPAFGLILRPDTELDPKQIFDKVNEEVGDAVENILKMDENELPRKFKTIIHKAKENVRSSNA